MVYAELERESSTSSLPQETEIKIYLLDKRTKGRKKVHKTQPNRKSTERRGREGRWSSLKKKNGEWALADQGFPKPPPPLAHPPRRNGKGEAIGRRPFPNRRTGDGGEGMEGRGIPKPHLMPILPYHFGGREDSGLDTYTELLSRSMGG